MNECCRFEKIQRVDRRTSATDSMCCRCCSNPQRITHKILITYTCAFCDSYKEFEVSNVCVSVCWNVTYSCRNTTVQSFVFKAFFRSKVYQFRKDISSFSWHCLHIVCSILQRKHYDHFIFLNIYTFRCNLFVWKFFKFILLSWQHKKSTNNNGRMECNGIMATSHFQWN